MRQHTQNDVGSWRVGLLVLYLAAGQTSLMRNVETKLLDLRIRLRRAQHPKVPVALVLIDDKSIAELGRWSWSRNHFATVVRPSISCSVSQKHIQRAMPCKP